MWQGTRKWGILNKAQSLHEKNGYKVIDCYYHHFKLKYLRGVRLLSLFHLPFVLLFMAAVWERVSMMTPFNCFPRVAFTNFSSSRLLLLPIVVNGWPHRNIATCPQKLLKCFWYTCIYHSNTASAFSINVLKRGYPHIVMAYYPQVTTNQDTTQGWLLQNCITATGNNPYIYCSWKQPQHLLFFQILCHTQCNTKQILTPFFLW